MRMNILQLLASAGLLFSVQASEAGSQIFQWTNTKGVIHFTDNPYSIPESVRNSSALIVRKDLDTKNNPSIDTSEPFAALRTRALQTLPISMQSNPRRPYLCAAGSEHRGGRLAFATTAIACLPVRR